MLVLFLGIVLVSFVSAYQLNFSNLVCEGNFTHLKISDPNLVLYMPFDVQEDSDNITYDYSSNDNDGTIEGAMYWNRSLGYYGSAYEFDGVDDYIEIANSNSLNPSTELTISFWANPGTSDELNDRFLSKYYPSAGYDFSLNGVGDLRLTINANWTDALKTNSNVFNHDEWSYFTVTFDNGLAKIYVNGLEVGSKTLVDSTINSNTATLKIGIFSSVGLFNGSIDEVMIFNRSLSTSEIEQIYNSTYSRFYPTGEFNFTNWNLSSSETLNISFQDCQILNGSYFQGKANDGEWINLTNCQFNDSEFSGDLNSVNFTLKFVSASNGFYSPLLIGNRGNTVNASNFAVSLNLTFPPTNSSPYYDYNDSYYGAGSNPTGNPIGGFLNYSRIVSSEDATYYVNTKQEFFNALNMIIPGEIIYLNDSVTLEFDKSETNIIINVENITIASGRGNNYSQGALLKMGDWILTDMSINTLFRVNAPNVRFTGLRISGNDESSHWEAHNAVIFQNRTDLGSSPSLLGFPSNFGINSASDSLEVDNCEITGWRYAGVYADENSTNAYVHHNYIHHNIRHGLGYGVSTGYGTNITLLVEANLFNHNRHSIVSTYELNSYEARYNIALGERAWTSFDRHGSVELGYGGLYTIIHHNTFYNIKPTALTLSFIDIYFPAVEDGGQFYNNFFPVLNSNRAFYFTGGEATNTTFFSNLYNSSGNQYYSEPVAIASASDYNVSISELITFNASLSYSDENSVRYVEWDFADNSSFQYCLTTTHSFSEPGRYLVKATVFDETGFLNSTYLNITVNPSDITKTYLDFWMFEESFVDSPEYVVKRARINNEIVWEQNFTDNVSRWQHIEIEVPENLTMGDSINLTLGVEVLQNYTDPLYPNPHEVEFFDIYFDGISVLRCGEELVESYEGDFEYADNNLYYDPHIGWNNQTSYERRMNGVYAFKVSPIYRSNYTAGETYGWSLNNITLNSDCTLSISNDAQNSNTETSSSIGTGTYKPSKSSLEKGYSVNIVTGQKVRVIYGDDKTKEVEVKSVSEEKVVVSVDGVNYEISSSASGKIDLDNDGFYDVEISNKKVYSNGVANLGFKLINEEVPSDEQESFVENISEVVKNIEWYVYVIAGVVIVLIVVGIVLKKRK